MRRLILGCVCALFIYANVYSQFQLPEMVKNNEPAIFKNSTTYLDSAELDLFINETMSAYHIPGLAACAVKNGQIYWTGSYGYANIEENIEVTDSTLFLLASVSKPFTATALMQLWEQGLFNLDDNINDYLAPELQVQNPLFPDDAITFRMLLTHTSSIKDNWALMTILFSMGEDSPIPLKSLLIDYFTPGGTYYNATANFNNWAPGTGWDYSNAGYALAGYMVEAMTDSVTTFDKYCQDSIFTPLGMNKTSWFLANLNIDDIAVPYNYSGAFIPYGHYGFPVYPAGQLRSNTLQLASFLTAYLQKGELNGVRILESSTVDLMTTIQNTDVAPTQGLSWFIYNNYGKLLHGHGGATLGTRTDLSYCPAQDLGVIVLTNGESGTGLYLIVEKIYEFVDIADKVVTAFDNAPLTFVLHQNYPNPFNTTTIINYNLPIIYNIELTIFNTAGQKVITLASGKQEKGNYNYEWDGAGLPSGVYYYRIAANAPGEIGRSFVQTKKLVLLK